MPNLVLLAGIPGTGKSTFAKTFFDLKYAIVSSDEIRKRLAGSLRSAHDQQLKPWDVFYSEIADRLAHSVDVLADATFLTFRHRQRARELADQAQAQLHLILFTNCHVAHTRNAARDADAKVPDQAMDDMMKLYWGTLLDIADEDYDTVTTIKDFA